MEGKIVGWTRRNRRDKLGDETKEQVYAEEEHQGSVEPSGKEALTWLNRNGKNGQRGP